MRWAPVESKSKVIIFPYWKDNPYPTVAALATAAAGFDVTGVVRLESLLPALESSGSGDILHVHWTAPIVQRVDDRDVAAQRLEDFTTAVDSFLARGGRLVWTVHNAVPHDLRFADLEDKVTTFLASRASIVHVMSPATARVVPELADVPAARIVRVPHPTYHGIYPSAGSRIAARESFGLGADDRVVAFVGQLRAYKGLDVLFAALDALPEGAREHTVLLLAGKCAEGEEESLEAQLPAGIRVVFAPGFVPDDDLARWYQAADLAVLPYRRILNSGSAHLAATFDTRIALPDEPHLREEYGDEAWVSFFDPDNSADDLARLLAEESSFTSDDEAFTAFAAERSPWRFSERMYRDVYARARDTAPVARAR